MFAIFTIKLFFFGIIFINQGCSNDNFYEEGVSANQFELEKFIGSVKKASEEIRSSKIVIDPKSDGNDITYSQRIADGEEPTEEEAQLILQPVMIDGVDLLKSYGVTETEIIAEFGSLNSPDIATAAMAVYRVNDMAQSSYFVEELEDNDYVLNDFSFISSTAYAQTGNTYLDCALVAVGVDAVVDYFQGRIKSLGKKGVMKIIRKVASRTLGWVGAAITVYAYVGCLNEAGVFDGGSNNETDTGTATHN